MNPPIRPETKAPLKRLVLAKNAPADCANIKLEQSA
jgi:hypothetical protein